MPPMTLPAPYAWLEHEEAPKVLVEAVKLYGVVEAVGAADNPTILAWAREVGATDYTHDSIAWCGLFAAVCARRAGYDPPRNFLRALAWSAWGEPSPQPMLGDVLTFQREGGGHVGFYVGEDEGAYHVLGGNQSDRVKVSRIAKSRLHAARRSAWKVAQPPNVRRVILDASGELSHNEA